MTCRSMVSFSVVVRCPTNDRATERGTRIGVDAEQVVRRRPTEEYGCSLVRENVRMSTILLSVQEQDLRDAALSIAQFPPRDIVA
jgi:hypothetical protein